jgi:hypothetical protein
LQLGKPHPEQDQIGEERWPASTRLSGRSLEPAGNVGPREMIVAVQTDRTRLMAYSLHVRSNRRSHLTRFTMEMFE